MYGILVVVAALGGLIYLAYRGVTLLILAPGLAMLAVLASLERPLLASYTQIFMVAAGDFIVQYFPVFLLGAIFGKLMEDSGSAEVLANATIRKLGSERAILAVVLSCAAMTYGGVSLFVVAFAVFPIAAAVFRRADLPKRLIPGTIALGAFTFTMTALPGTPAIQNAIPMPYFGTSPFAAPGLGILTALIMFALGQLWLERRARATSEGYGDHPDTAPLAATALRDRAAAEGFDIAEISAEARPAELPSLMLAAMPLATVIAVNLAFTTLVIPAMNTDYLAASEYGATTIDSVRGIWSIIVALVISILVMIAVNRSRLPRLNTTLDAGAHASLLPIFNTASLVGFGSVIASLSAFALIRDSVVDIGGDNPLISVAVSVSLLAGMTGSASGGMSIALTTLGAVYLETAQAAGISPDLMHRVTAVATGGLDALPHNGAVITLLAICGLTHREAYFDIAVVAVVVPIIALIVLITLGTLLGSF
ncbi:GntP family permease (plasmid) [Aminobacter sp. NyZ550]|jgi:H+/gluconate symporter-like permease|uniref:GntP family permease n=3 Tax=Alphaproteobacteria TaxID=28211 RepID=A0A5D4H5J4_9HYPH|nr:MULTISPECIES: GntP family permease [Alphaproteobacteria]TYR35877.1 GntP family permease [Mesorhizobium microcysteis]WAX98440.1 GntP family permease [Aminobacter sp. NyZ550]